MTLTWFRGDIGNTPGKIRVMTTKCVSSRAKACRNTSQAERDRQTGNQAGRNGDTHMTHISDLASRPPPGDADRNIVLEHYHEIRSARMNGWQWSAIAESLGRNTRSLAAAFRRVEAAIKRGRLDAARLGGKAARPAPRPGVPQAATVGRFQNLDEG